MARFILKLHGAPNYLTDVQQTCSLLRLQGFGEISLAYTMKTTVCVTLSKMFRPFRIPVRMHSPLSLQSRDSVLPWLCPCHICVLFTVNEQSLTEVPNKSTKLRWSQRSFGVASHHACRTMKTSWAMSNQGENEAYPNEVRLGQVYWRSLDKLSTGVPPSNKTPAPPAVYGPGTNTNENQRKWPAWLLKLKLVDSEPSHPPGAVSTQLLWR